MTDPEPAVETSNLRPPIADYPTEHRAELLEFTEPLVDHDTQDPPGRTVGVDGDTTTEALVRNVTSYAAILELYERWVGAER